jgi:stearoyl-CoA desaturase (delta-9 desaturase)
MSKSHSLLWTGKTVLYIAFVVLLIWALPHYYLKIFVVLWYGNMFFLSGFHHRYASHQTYTMSPKMEKLFFLGSYLFQGSSYLSPYAYGIFHRFHHESTEELDDPTWLLVYKSLYGGNAYGDIFSRDQYQNKPIPKKYKKNIPEWPAFDRFAHTRISRIVWVIVYATLYIFMACKVDQIQNYPIPAFEWVQLGFVVAITCTMSYCQSNIINMWGHVIEPQPLRTIWSTKFYSKEEMEKMPISIPEKILKFLFKLGLSFILMGEQEHPHHHGKPSSANMATKWFHYDMTYSILWLLDLFKVIRLRNKH